MFEKYEYFLVIWQNVKPAVWTPSVPAGAVNPTGTTSVGSQGLSIPWHEEG